LNKQRTLFFTIALVAMAFAVATFSLLNALVWRLPTAKEVFANTSQSVVEVKAQTGENLTSYGSAVLIGKEGYFVSNAHVVTYTQLTIQHKFDKYYVRFSFENDYREATLVNYDSEIDVALLKLTDTPEFKLKPISLGSSEKLKSGDKVYTP
jgi:S1-C subfamily serine protease